MWYIIIKLSNKLISFVLSFAINHYHWLYIILQWLHDQKIALLWLRHTKLAWLIQRRVSKTIKPYTLDQRFLRNCRENWDISLILCRMLIKSLWHDNGSSYWKWMRRLLTESINQTTCSAMWCLQLMAA
jgi:hypothetical protein